jgi:hypothetical protein
MPNEAPYGHGCPPEPVTGKSSKYRTFGPEKREAGGGPSARGTQSAKEGNSHRDKVEACPQEWLRLHKPQADCVTPSCVIDLIVFLYSSALKFTSQTQVPFGAPPPALRFLGRTP